MEEGPTDPTGRSQRWLRGKKKKLQPLAFWGPFSSLSCRTFPRCAYAPTYLPPTHLTTWLLLRSCVSVHTRTYFGRFVVWVQLLRNSRKCESRISAYTCRMFKSGPFYNRVTEHLHSLLPSYVTQEEPFLPSREQFWMELNSTWNLFLYFLWHNM